MLCEWEGNRGPGSEIHNKRHLRAVFLEAEISARSLYHTTTFILPV